MYGGKRIGVAVAAFNEEAFVGEVIATMPDFVDRIYVVDDASTDSTAKVLGRLEHPRLRVIRHSRNGGVGAANASAFVAALIDGMDVVATMAGDGQMDPNILHMFLDPIVNGCADYTKGDRLTNPDHRRGMPAHRVLGTFILNLATRTASGYGHVRDAQGGYTAIHSAVLNDLDMIRLSRSRYAYENEILIQLHARGARMVNIPHPARYGGEKSTLHIIPFIAQVTADLLTGYIWRLHREHSLAQFRLRLGRSSPSIPGTDGRSACREANTTSVVAQP
jgi:glycosyltransferase involved in cell wall biosynthesis